MKSTPQKLICLLILLSITYSGSLTAQTAESAESDTSNIFDQVLLDRITVVGAPVWQTNIPGAASYINIETLQEHNYDDINRVLRSISGINIQEEDGYGLRPNIGIRGAGVERSSKINLMEDGVLIAPAPYAAPAAYYFPMVSRMNAIEVRKGSAQIEYGPNSTGGAINMISTPIPFKLKANAELGIGENNGNRLYANIGDSKKNYGYLIEGLNLATDGFKNLDNGESTGFNIQNFMGKFMLRTNSDASVYQRLDLKATYYDEVSDETYLGLTRDDFESSPFRRYAASQQDEMNAEHSQFMIRHFAQFSENFDITTTLYRNNFRRNWYKLQSVNGTGPAGVVRNPAENRAALDILKGADSANDALSVRANNREYYSQGVETKASIVFKTRGVDNHITAGVRYHYDEEDRFQFEDGYRMVNGTMVLTTSGAPGSQANRIGSAKALSLYVQDEIEYGKITVTPGFRYEAIDFKNENFGGSDPERTGADASINEYTVNEFIPGIGLVYSATENLSLISGIHKGFSPPSPGSSADTKSEQSVNYELGARYANNSFNSELIGFFNNYKNLLGSDLAASGGGGTTAQFNAGSVDVTGIEATLNSNLKYLLNTPVSLPVTLNYTYTNATFQNSFDSDYDPWGTVNEGDHLPFIPEHQLNASLGLELSKLKIDLNANSVSEMRTLAGNGSINPNFSTDSYFLLDLSGSYQITQNFNLFTNLKNVLDETYIVSDRPHGLRPGLPRTLMGGVRFNL